MTPEFIKAKIDALKTSMGVGPTLSIVTSILHQARLQGASSDAEDIEVFEYLFEGPLGIYSLSEVWRLFPHVLRHYINTPESERPEMVQEAFQDLPSLYAELVLGELEGSELWDLLERHPELVRGWTSEVAVDDIVEAGIEIWEDIEKALDKTGEKIGYVFFEDLISRYDPIAYDDAEANGELDVIGCLGTSDLMTILAGAVPRTDYPGHPMVLLTAFGRWDLVRFLVQELGVDASAASKSLRDMADALDSSYPPKRGPPGPSVWEHIGED